MRDTVQSHHHISPMIIGGASCEAETSFDVLNPATGEVAGRVWQARPEDLDAAVAAAAAAFPVWSATSDEERQAACNAIAAIIADHSEELATIVTREQGKPLNGLGSRWELGGAAAWAEYTAQLALEPKTLQDNNEGKVEMIRRPLGVVGSITPWNFPLMIAVWQVLPALRTGNTVVLKPSPFTPLASIRMVELMNEVLPAGVMNIVTGADDASFNLGAALSAHPDVAKVVFTGSVETGKAVMRSSADTIKRLTLELGGNDAGIVLPDADPETIAEGLFWGAFINNGQTCAALKRLYVHADIHDDVCAALAELACKVPVGDGTNEESVLGPVATKAQFNKLLGLIDNARTKGQVLAGGEILGGQFLAPTLVAGLENGDALVDQEQFGPVLPIIKYHDVEEAIASANDSPFGLGGSVWGTDLEAARAVAERLECGSVWINKHGAIQPNAPFGGRKSSGFGVEFAEEGLQEYTDIQVIFS